MVIRLSGFRRCEKIAQDVYEYARYRPALTGTSGAGSTQLQYLKRQSNIILKVWIFLISEHLKKWLITGIFEKPNPHLGDGRGGFR